MLLLEYLLECVIGLVDVVHIDLEAIDNHVRILTSISLAIFEPNEIGLSVVSDVFLELTEDGLMCLLFAQVDLLCVSKVVRDVLLLITILVYLFVICKLHFLKSWRNTVGEVLQLVHGFLFHGLAVLKVSIEDGFFVHSVAHQAIVDHFGCSIFG